MLLCIILSVSLFLSNPYLLFVMKQRVFVLRDFSDTLLFKQSIYCKVIRCHPGLTGVELPISRTISDSSWSRKVWDAQSEVPCIAIISVLSLEKKNNHDRWVPVSHAVRQERKEKRARKKREREGRREWTSNVCNLCFLSFAYWRMYGESGTEILRNAQRLAECWNLINEFSVIKDCSN